MEVKGTGVLTTLNFVKDRFPAQYDLWMNALPIETQTILKGMIVNAGWYPIQEAYLTPIDQIVRMFYHNDEARGGEALGSYSAEFALKGLYKTFVKAATPQYMMERASSMISTYYRACEVETLETGTKEITLTIRVFPKTSKVFEHRVGGWCKKALELTNCKDVRLRFVQHMSEGAPITQIKLNWN
jgi:hypothetical protein